METIKVLIVEDDPTVADLHRRFVSIIDGFSVSSIARNGKEALTFLKTLDVNLVILDIFMPEGDGIDVLRSIRENRKDVDVIMVTAAQEGNFIQAAVRLGVFDYLLKPFSFSRFEDTMLSFKKHYAIMHNKNKAFSQVEIDKVLTPSKTSGALPKGVQRQTLEKIISVFRQTSDPCSVDDVAKQTGLSRVTVMRYVRYLLNAGELVEKLYYKQIGRPISQYIFLK